MLALFCATVTKCTRLTIDCDKPHHPNDPRCEHVKLLRQRVWRVH